MEALTGFEFRIKHFDDRVLIVKSEPDTVIKPGDIKVYVSCFSLYRHFACPLSGAFIYSLPSRIDNEGMPIKGRGGLQRGRLFIKFEVVFPTPEDLKDAAKQSQLKAVLPAPGDLPMLPTETDVEEVVAKAYVMPQGGRGPHGHGHGGESDEDDEQGGGGARTATCTGTIM